MFGTAARVETATTVARGTAAVAGADVAEGTFVS